MKTPFEIQGTIKQIGDTQTFEGSEFTKREVVITTPDDKYPQDIKLDFTKGGTGKLDAFEAGQEVKVTFDIRGNEYNSKYYVNLSAWKIEAAEGVQQSAASMEQEEDDIPF